MSYALMSTRALKSVREATTDEQDELAKRYEIIVVYLRKRLAEIDVVLATRLRNKKNVFDDGSKSDPSRDKPDQETDFKSNKHSNL